MWQGLNSERREKGFATTRPSWSNFRPPFVAFRDGGLWQGCRRWTVAVECRQLSATLFRHWRRRRRNSIRGTIADFHRGQSRSKWTEWNGVGWILLRINKLTLLHSSCFDLLTANPDFARAVPSNASLLCRAARCQLQELRYETGKP